MKVSKEQLTKLIKEQMDRGRSAEGDGAYLWRNIAWAISSTTKNIPRTVKEYMSSTFTWTPTDSSEVNDIVGFDMSKALIDYLLLWQEMEEKKKQFKEALKKLDEVLRS